MNQTNNTPLEQIKNLTEELNVKELSELQTFLSIKIAEKKTKLKDQAIAEINRIAKGINMTVKEIMAFRPSQDKKQKNLSHD